MLHLTVLLILMLALPPNGMSANHVIIVSCCLKQTMGDYSNADDAFEHAQSLDGTISIHIQPGNYTLHYSHQFQNKSEISIVGSGQDLTILNCNGPDRGIAFVNSDEIQVCNLSIVGCGANYTSTTRNINNYMNFLSFHVALYFKFCRNVTVSGVAILHSSGTGLAFLNTADRVEISNSKFSSNGISQNKLTAGGGGLYIESTTDFPYGENETENTETTYHVVNCKFLENQAKTGDIKPTHITHHYNHSNYVSFGKGGGMTVYFNGNANWNNIFIHECNFTNNSAELGGGLSVSFLGSSKNNKVQITSSTFQINNCSMVPPLVSRYSAGGGVHVNFESLSLDNQAIISDCSFITNSAHWGGGFSLYSKTVPQGERAADMMKITDCHFERNIARIGAAVDMYHRSVSSQGYSLTPQMINCTFVNNGGMYTYPNGSWGATFTIVNLEHLQAIFRGNITFYKNEGSALGLQETVTQVMPSAFLSFIRNIARNGGGIAFMGKSWMVIHEETTVVFDGNAAVERGGAIYAAQLQNFYSVYSYSCFIRYFTPDIHPSHWNATLYFRNNSEFVLGPGKQQNSIYASSILPCVWPSGPNSDVESDIKATFCDWNSWVFDRNCTADITTSAHKFGMNEYNISMHPGIPQPLGVQVYDDFAQPVTNTTIFTVSSESDTWLQSIITSNNDLTVHGIPNMSSYILLQTSDTRTVYSRLEINLLPCPPGYTQNITESMACKCRGGQSFAGYVFCPQYTNSSIFVGNCISYSEVKIKGIASKEVILARCPFFAGYQLSGATISLPMNVNELDEAFCRKNWSRTGKLCSNCTSNRGISVFSSTYDCIKCTESVTNWLIYIAVTFLPLTIFFLIIVIFQVGVTSPQANGYIFFSQIITIPLAELLIESAWTLVLAHDNPNLHSSKHKAHILTDVLLFPYSIWSLDFFRIFFADKVCLHKSLRVIHVLALQYIPAFYPIFLVIISYILIELHARNCRPVVWLWKPFCFLCVRFRRKWEAKTSIIDAFATFILLSYTKILLVSISLLTPTNVLISNGTTVGRILNYDPSVDFFQGDHLPFAILALAILVAFAIPPLLLLLYPSQTFQRCLNFFKLQSHCLQTFVDAFQGCYKNGADGGPERRYFAGIYFLFRIIIFLIYTVINDLSEQFAFLQGAYLVFILTFVILRPYKKDRYNILDSLIISILAATNLTSAYIYNHLRIYKSLLHGLWYFTYALFHIPTLYMAGFIIYWFCIHSKFVRTHCISKLYRQNQEDDGEALDNYFTFLDQASHHSTQSLFSVSTFPDRLQHPERYNNLDQEENENEFPNESEGMFLRGGRRYRQQYRPGNRTH